MKINILGYLILRKPQYNFDKLGRGAFLKTAPKVGSLYYGGIERMPWFDVDESFYDNSLPEDLMGIRGSFLQDSLFGDFKVCRSLDESRLLLDYSNKVNAYNELVAISSDCFTEQAELFEAGVDTTMGYDLYCQGYGSLVREGVFTKPNYFEEFISKLNEYGVFDVDQLIDQYISKYQSLSMDGKLEKMEGKIQKFMLYKVD